MKRLLLSMLVINLAIFSTKSSDQEEYLRPVVEIDFEGAEEQKSSSDSEEEFKALSGSSGSSISAFGYGGAGGGQGHSPTVDDDRKAMIANLRLGIGKLKDSGDTSQINKSINDFLSYSSSTPRETRKKGLSLINSSLLGAVDLADVEDDLSNWVLPDTTISSPESKEFHDEVSSLIEKNAGRRSTRGYLLDLATEEDFESIPGLGIRTARLVHILKGDENGGLHYFDPNEERDGSEKIEGPYITNLNTEVWAAKVKTDKGFKLSTMFPYGWTEDKIVKLISQVTDYKWEVFARTGKDIIVKVPRLNIFILVYLRSGVEVRSAFPIFSLVKYDFGGDINIVNAKTSDDRSFNIIKSPEEVRQLIKKTLRRCDLTSRVTCNTVLYGNNNHIGIDIGQELFDLGELDIVKSGVILDIKLDDISSLIVDREDGSSFRARDAIIDYLDIQDEELLSKWAHSRQAQLFDDSEKIVDAVDLAKERAVILRAQAEEKRQRDRAAAVDPDDVVLGGDMFSEDDDW